MKHRTYEQVPYRIMISQLIAAPMKIAAALSLTLALAITPLAAQEASSWSEDHASRARLITGGAHGDGRLVGLEISMDEGYKTYWRHPGDSGLPPEIDWAGSQNVADVEILFPAPRRFRDASGVFFGYDRAVILPLLVTPLDPSLPMRLSLSLEYGVCKDICIPARAELVLDPADKPAKAHADAIAGAVEQVPVPQDPGEAGPVSITGVTAGEPGHLMVSVRAPHDALLFAEGPDYRWFLAPEEQMRQGAQADEGVFVVELAERPAVVDEPVRLVFTLAADGHAIETVVELAPEQLPAR
jgi:DsbC/DsbD-like thiol-disulfide interchange protein